MNAEINRKKRRTIYLKTVSFFISSGSSGSVLSLFVRQLQPFFFLIIHKNYDNKTGKGKFRQSHKTDGVLAGYIFHCRKHKRRKKSPQSPNGGNYSIHNPGLF